MPLVRIDLLEGKSEQYRAQVGDILYQTLVDVLNVPAHDRFQVITEHTKASLPFDREYLGIHRSDDSIFCQITLNSGRSTDLGSQECFGGAFEVKGDWMASRPYHGREGPRSIGRGSPMRLPAPV